MCGPGVANYLGIPADLIDPDLDGIDLDAAIQAVQAAAEPLDWNSLSRERRDGR